VLCGIDISKAGLEDIFRQLGEPVSVQEVGSDKEYLWKKGDVSIRVVLGIVGPPVSSPPEYYLEFIETCGTRAVGQYGRTGRGLALGDTLERLVAIYGSHYVATKNNGGSDVRLEWSDTTVLHVEFDRAGGVSCIELLAPE
jgi:hypothetical protein